MWTSRTKTILGIVAVSLITFFFVDYFEIVPRRVCFVEKNGPVDSHVVESIRLENGTFFKYLKMSKN
jgi:hypothetical protein